MSEEDDSQKTEEPTQRRLEEAEKKGQIPMSREINNFFMLFSLLLMMVWIAPATMRHATRSLATFIEMPHQFRVGDEGFVRMVHDVEILVLVLLAAPLLLAVVAAFAGRLIQHRFLISFESIAPKLERISPLKGLKRMFSSRSVVEFLKGLLKIIVVGVVGYLAVHAYLPRMYQSPSYDVMDQLRIIGTLTVKMMIGMCCAVFLMAIFDLLYQRFEHTKSLRMSKQELKDEYKQQEGDPHIKQRLRQLRRERARKRMMAAVPTADVVITNPTHFAVALKYDSLTMPAPVLVAKGTDLVAFRIRDVAKASDVPVVENPPLARALHASVELDREIPLEHYKAVAEVISYVYRLKGRRIQRTAPRPTVSLQNDR